MNSKKIFQSAVVLLISLSMHTLTMGQTGNSKPGINFTNFMISAIQKRIIIDWGTDNKVATNYFEIERSSDGINFKTIAMVLGPDPKQPGCDCYKCFDKPDLKTKKYFYRLKHVSVNGEIEMSETKMLAVNK